MELFVLVRMINGIVVTVNWFHHQDDDVIVDSYLFICNRSNTRSQCDIDNLTGEPTTEHDYLYVIEWSRFGNIKLEKWNKRDLEWIEQ